MVEIKNLKKAAQRILSAIKKNERIILYGDADLDGTTSVIILEEAIKNLKGEISAIYFPDREKENYGLTETGLNFLSPFAPALLICLDLGITNFKEVKLAREKGFKVIIIDHHEALKEIPEVLILVDPKQKTDKYPFKQLAACGVVYKLAQLMFKNKIPSALEQNFLELTALGTLADMMAEIDDNKIYIEKGLPLIISSFRPGLRVLLKLVRNNSNSEREMVSRIISILNISEIKNHLTESYLILNSSTEAEVQELTQEIFQKSFERSLKIKEIVGEVETCISQNSDPIIFEGDVDWTYLLLGAVASRICNKHKKPTFIFKIGEKESKGSVRAPKGINSVKMMEDCSHLLRMFGGHAAASGFALSNKNLEKFKNCLLSNIKKYEIKNLPLAEP